ncbi:hypothetical protein [Mesorhizobium sp. B2-3-12]|uniref:hypothetical protein n=1 Tax=Mesorhizobium sp. B2-3-12 TaxID=2589952 RepID=UPI001FEFFE9B|nr:hypothetical protein [Mesorhizobium sp. B2-3-12]
MDDIERIELDLDRLSNRDMDFVCGHAPTVWRIRAGSAHIIAAVGREATSRGAATAISSSCSSM